MAIPKLKKKYQNPHARTFVKGVGGGLNLAKMSAEELKGLYERCDPGQRAEFFEGEEARIAAAAETEGKKKLTS